LLSNIIYCKNTYQTFIIVKTNWSLFIHKYSNWV